MSTPSSVEQDFKLALAAKIAPAASSSSSSNTTTYYGITLRYLTPEELATNGLDESDRAAWVGSSGRVALFDSDGQNWFYADDNAEVLPDTPYDYGSQTHYNPRGAAVIVPLDQISTAGMGNQQEWKLVSLRKGIRYGMPIPPISVTRVAENSYQATNGFNRVEASREQGFTHIPVVIEN